MKKLLMSLNRLLSALILASNISTNPVKATGNTIDKC